MTLNIELLGQDIPNYSSTTNINNIRGWVHIYSTFMIYLVYKEHFLIEYGIKQSLILTNPPKEHAIIIHCWMPASDLLMLLSTTISMATTQSEDTIDPTTNRGLCKHCPLCHVTSKSLWRGEQTQKNGPAWSPGNISFKMTKPCRVDSP